MPLFGFTGRDWTLEETPEGPVAVIPSPCLWPLAAFMGLWLSGWVMGELEAARQLRQLLAGPLSPGALFPAAFLLVWLAGWTAGGVFAWGVFLFSLRGRETVKAEGGRLLLRLETFLGLGWTWRYDIAGMKPPELVRLRMPRGPEGGGAGPAGELLPALAHIAIESGGRKRRLGAGLREERARDLLYTLTSRFGLPRGRQETGKEQEEP